MWSFYHWWKVCRGLREANQFTFEKNLLKGVFRPLLFFIPHFSNFERIGKNFFSTNFPRTIHELIDYPCTSIVICSADEYFSAQLNT